MEKVSDAASGFENCSRTNHFYTLKSSQVHKCEGDLPKTLFSKRRKLLGSATFRGLNAVLAAAFFRTVPERRQMQSE